MPLLSRTRLSAFVAAAAVAAVGGVILMQPPRPRSPALGLQGDVIVVNERGVTLEQLAERLGRPDAFRYDPATRAALANKSLLINGRLVIGRRDDPSFKELLEFNTSVCGQLNLVVGESGELDVYHSAIATRSRIVTEEMCTRGYTVFCEGRMVLDHAQISYMSGSYSRTFRRTASARLLDSAFCFNDGNAASFFEPDGRRLLVKRCSFSSQGNWGVVVRGSSGPPLRFVQCAFDAKAGAVLNAGRARVELVDCRFDKSKIRFSQLTGRVTVKWTVLVETSFEGSPAPGALVVARSAPETALKETLRAQTGPRGRCALELVEFVAAPSARTRRDGVNNASPYLITARLPDGRSARARLDVKCPGQCVRLRLVRAE